HLRFEAVNRKRLLREGSAELVLELARSRRSEMLCGRFDRLLGSQRRRCIDLPVEHDTLAKHIRILALRPETHRIPRSESRHASVELLEMNDLRSRTGSLRHRNRNE